MKRYSKEEKKEILKKFGESGKTATEFGKEVGVHRITLLKWSKDNSNKTSTVPGTTNLSYFGWNFNGCRD